MLSTLAMVAYPLLAHRVDITVAQTGLFLGPSMTWRPGCGLRARAWLIGSEAAALRAGRAAKPGVSPRSPRESPYCADLRRTSNTRMSP